MENETLSTTSPTRKLPDKEQIIYIIVNLTISIIIFTINAFVICLYCWKRHILLKTSSNRLLFSLSVCDILTGIGVVLTILCNFFPDLETPSTAAGYAYRIILDVYMTFLVKTVVMHLCGITLDRYLALFCALRYRTIVTKKAIKRYIIASWCLPLIASTIQLSWLHMLISSNRNENDLETVFNVEIWYSIFSFIVFLTIPMILLASAFIAMFCEIRRVMRYTPRHHVGRSSQVSSRERRVIYSFALMYSAFVVLAMPYFSLRLWIDIHAWSGNKIKLSNGVVHSAVTFKYITSIVRPVLYTISSSELRLVMKHLLEENPLSIRSYTISLSRKYSSTKRKYGGGETVEIAC